MCVTTERNSTICGHRASFTTPCKKKTSTSILNHLQKCSPVLNSTYHFDLCHDCRHFWRNHGVDEKEAIERTREYRTDHNHHAPLSPARVLAHNEGKSTDASVVPESLRFERKENASTTTLWPSMDDARLGTASKPLPCQPSKCRGQRSNGKGKGVNGQLAHKAENASTIMSWPRVAYAQIESHSEILPQLLSQAHFRPGTAGSDRSGLETILIGIESEELVAGSQDFELGNVDRPLPLKVRKESFDRQKHFPASQSHRSRSTTQPKPRLDLDKPLPRPPRCDSPMPGRPFDSQNPERDLPANKYYPRFI